jgi:hypothetical protein
MRRKAADPHVDVAADLRSHADALPHPQGPGDLKSFPYPSASPSTTRKGAPISPGVDGRLPTATKAKTTRLVTIRTSPPNSGHEIPVDRLYPTRPGSKPSPKNLSDGQPRSPRSPEELSGAVTRRRAAVPARRACGFRFTARTPCGSCSLKPGISPAHPQESGHPHCMVESLTQRIRRA